MTSRLISLVGRRAPMVPADERWTLPNLDVAIAWCRKRNSEGIHCTLDVLEKYARTREEIQAAVGAYRACIGAVATADLKASVSVKLSTLGAVYDRALCRKALAELSEDASAHHVRIEVDMEGRGLVQFTLDSVIGCQTIGCPLTLALQAYLDRTPADLVETILPAGIRPRIVKGAYIGDTGDFEEIQARFRRLVEGIVARDTPFSVGTHDPELIRWLVERLGGRRENAEFGFLRGLSDQTKVSMASDGWKVAEYVPFGANAGGYIARRYRYLEMLHALGRNPAP